MTSLKPSLFIRRSRFIHPSGELTGLEFPAIPAQSGCLLAVTKVSGFGGARRRCGASNPFGHLVRWAGEDHHRRDEADCGAAPGVRRGLSESFAGIGEFCSH